MSFGDAVLYFNVCTYVCMYLIWFDTALLELSVWCGVRCATGFFAQNWKRNPPVVMHAIPFVFNLFVSLFSSFSFLIDSIHFIPCFCLFCFLDWTVIRDVSFAWIATWLLGCNLGNLRLQPVKNSCNPWLFRNLLALQKDIHPAQTQHNTTQHNTAKDLLYPFFFPKLKELFSPPNFQ